VIPADIEDAAAGAHPRGDQPRAADRAFQIELEECVELPLVRPARRLPGEHVSAGVVDPHVDVLERPERFLHDRGATVRSAEVRSQQRMGGTKLAREGSRGL